MISNVVLLHDLLRGTRTFPDALFALIREPIRQGCSIDIGFPPGGRRLHGLRQGFEIETFRKLATENGLHDWNGIYYRLPEPAREYLAGHLPESDLLISFEMPPWLVDLCETSGLSFLDIRVSPLRFGRDLYMALRTSSPDLYRRLSEYAVPEEELRLEASYLAANVNFQKRRLEEAQRYDFTLEDCTIFVGQAPYDASLIGLDGNSLRCEDFAEHIREVVQGRPLLHKAHPFAVEFSEHERLALSAMTGQPVRPCLQNAYQILSAEEDIQLIGISSGLLQEAVWFDKPAHTLFKPFVPLASPTAEDRQAYQQVHFHNWITPGFWHSLLTPERRAPRLTQLTALPHSHARETLDHWWDYAKVLTWERTLPYESFVRSGGAVLRQRIESLENAAMPPHGSGSDSTVVPQNKRELISEVAASSSEEGFSQPVLSGSHERWLECLAGIRSDIDAHPQQFGRGDLYQAHEVWGVKGQRPTLQRIRAYDLEKWLPAHADALDIGCNIGMFGLALSDRISTYYGFDNNPLLIDIARRMANVRGIQNCRFECESFQEFSANNESLRFDIVFSFAVHVWIGMSTADYAKTMHGLLKPDGILVWESNRLETNDKDFFQDVRHFMDAGFAILSCGKLKDDRIIERGFYVLKKQANS